MKQNELRSANERAERNNHLITDKLPDTVDIVVVDRSAEINSTMLPYLKAKGYKIVYPLRSSGSCS